MDFFSKYPDGDINEVYENLKAGAEGTYLLRPHFEFEPTLLKYDKASKVAEAARKAGASPLAAWVRQNKIGRLIKAGHDTEEAFLHNAETGNGVLVLYDGSIDQKVRGFSLPAVVPGATKTIVMSSVPAVVPGTLDFTGSYRQFVTGRPQHTYTYVRCERLC